jgi:hypothetical protein
MTIANEVLSELTKEQTFFADPRFIELKEFYERMLREGIALKKTYELPPIDTIGRDVASLLLRKA